MDWGWLVGPDGAYWEWTCVGRRRVSGGRANGTPSPHPSSAQITGLLTRLLTLLPSLPHMDSQHSSSPSLATLNGLKSNRSAVPDKTSMTFLSLYAMYSNKSWPTSSVISMPCSPMLVLYNMSSIPLNSKSVDFHMLISSSVTLKTVFFLTTLTV